MPTTLPPYFLVFDVESVGLHGDAFAFGYVVLDTATGAELDSGLVQMDPGRAPLGLPDDRAWVAEHVMPALGARWGAQGGVAETAAHLRGRFWAVWDTWRAHGAWVAADCPWPVEARFLSQCVADHPHQRAGHGPYPLIDVASVRLAAGLDPLGTDERRPDEQPAHNPLADARQSARLLREALADA
jgi:hypothetical protein